jgi:formylglycine-generating enzyme required for sulfatase activity
MAAPHRSSPPLPTARIPPLLGLLASTACAPATERPSTAPRGLATTPPATATTHSANELVAPVGQRYPMARVPAGRYRLGCTPGQGAGCEGGVTEHNLPHDVLIGTFEVTQGLYAEVSGTDPTPDLECGVDCPVHFVSAAEAEAFADALSVREGLEPCGRRDVTAAASTCRGYRLPSEEEWEVAARAGADTPYAGGAQAALVAWTAENSAHKRHPVGRLQPNALGIYDMSGGVYELIAAQEGREGRALRGGCWSVPAEGAQIHARSSISDGYRHHHVGFRLVRTAP